MKGNENEREGNITHYLTLPYLTLPCLNYLNLRSAPSLPPFFLDLPFWSRVKKGFVCGFVSTVGT